MLAQAPLFICFFLGIQRMALLPSFETGGAAWFTNLAVADPTYILPLLSGATFLATVEVRASSLAHTAHEVLTCGPIGCLAGRRGRHAGQPSWQ